jgi:leucine-rich repeat protein SHOC2
MINLKYLDDESQDGMEVRIFPSLEELGLYGLPNIEGLLKVERGEMFPCLSKLDIISCPKLGLPCLPSLKILYLGGCNNELLRSISTFCGLTNLQLVTGGERITSFPEGMFTNLTFLQTLEIQHFPKLKELPNEPFNLAMEHLNIAFCDELESLPEQIWESLQSLRILEIWSCKGLRCLPEGIRHLTSLEVLDIHECPTLKERCKEGTGEDWGKIAHIPKLKFS